MRHVTVSIIAAIARKTGAYGNTVDGKAGIPWKSKIDMRHFSVKTQCSSLAMGRGTFDSLPNKQLSERQMIVISRDTSADLGKNVIVCSSLDEAIRSAEHRSLFAIGGGELWKEALPRASRIYLTLVDIDVDPQTNVKTCPELLNFYQKYPHFILKGYRREKEETESGLLQLTFLHYDRET